MNSNLFTIKNLITLTLSSSLLFSCSPDETDLETTNELTTFISSNLSSKSEKLSISSYSASTAHNKYPVSNAFDNNLNTRWTGNGTSSSIYIDLGNSTSVDYVNIAFRGGNTRSYEFTYWISSDNSSWTYVQKKTSSGNTSDYETFDLTNNSSRYIRFKFQGSSVDNWNNVSELKVFGTPSQTSSESFISTNDGSFTLDDFQIESSSHLSSDTDKTTTSYDADDASVFGDWYELLGGDYYLKSASYDGKRTEYKEASGNEASLEADRVLKYEAEVNDIPSHGVTIAQLHNRGDGVKRPFVRVYIEEGKIHVKETTNDLTNSSGQWDDAVEGPSYTEGSKFKVQLTVSNGKLNVKVETTSGTLDQDFTPDVTNSVYDDSYYFKGGVYTEGDDKEPIIRFYSFEKE